MALNLSDRIAVMDSATMQLRCSGAVAQYANYLLGEPPGTTDAQLDWARQAIRNIRGMGQQVSAFLLNDPNFLNKGSEITDAELQGAVEAAIANHFIIEPESGN